MIGTTIEDAERLSLKKLDAVAVEYGNGKVAVRFPTSGKFNITGYVEGGTYSHLVEIYGEPTAIIWKDDKEFLNKLKEDKNGK